MIFNQEIYGVTAQDTHTTTSSDFFMIPIKENSYVFKPQKINALFKKNYDFFSDINFMKYLKVVLVVYQSVFLVAKYNFFWMLLILM